MRSLQDLLLEAAQRQGPDFASRRHVLTLLGAAAATPAALGVHTAFAQVDAEGKNNNAKKRRKKKQRGVKGDIDVLNYALTLEHLEYAFYRDGLNLFANNNQFPDGVRPRLIQIRDHEKAHVDTLISVIQSLGGTPVAEACYNFGYGNNVNQFLDVAQLLENTGVMAYDGAIASIKSADLQTAGATIATVEARHASYLNSVNGDDPFPDAFDMPRTQEQILAAAGGFIVACS